VVAVPEPSRRVPVGRFQIEDGLLRRAQFLVKGLGGLVECLEGIEACLQRLDLGIEARGCTHTPVARMLFIKVARKTTSFRGWM